MSSHSRRRGRRLIAGLAGLSLAVSGFTITALGAQAAPGVGSGEGQDVPPEVAADLQARGTATFWVRFEDKADLSRAEALGDWEARGQAVFDALTETAARSQAQVRAHLDADGIEYQAFWATNAIHVSAGTQPLVDYLLTSPGVEGIYAPTEYELVEPEMSPDDSRPAAIEWGVEDINAPDVWDEFGVNGEGIVVATIDTGVEWDHPALIDSYRGNNGDGTFTHDHNWFDAGHGNPNFPNDPNGHGTHVTGTMVGDDGGDNQIGVAPGAKWIAANGCCPSDAALIASGEWMLAPTDLNHENPDPDMRPHIINNSWGSVVPSNDPFMEDILEAWEAAGMLGIWANGNSGPNCATSGSPGSRILNYSAGSYDINHNISSFSGRGPGQDGEVKPNISAPGQNVRSSLPGGGYGLGSGTSMAAPHVAGAAALVWSAAPALVGDIATSKSLLDQSAIDHPDDQCGGTPEKNNVFGEGRLDALALVSSAPVDDAATIEGTVTDAESGDPLEGATVEIDGPSTRVLHTDEDGTYSTIVAAGDYTVDISLFGYLGQSFDITAEPGETVTVNAALDPAGAATVSGTVTDGSGHGWPLYAELSFEGSPESVFTDPATGSYSLQAPVGPQTLVVQTYYDGYLVVTEELELTGDTVVDISVPVDAASCEAPGYVHQASELLAESFDAEETPAGWTVTDEEGNDQVWRFDNPGNRANLTGGEGNFAIVDSDWYGSGNTQRTGLVSPELDFTDVGDPVLEFKQDFNVFGSPTTTVEVSVDGGETWETLLTQTTAVRGPITVVLPLDGAAGESAVHVRFYKVDEGWSWWWQVDDVVISDIPCVPVDGGLVVGNVYDLNTGEGIVGATVSSVEDPSLSGTSAATPDDDNLDDGFYWLFSSLIGDHEFQASATNFETRVQVVSVVADDVVVSDSELGSGFLVVEPTEFEAELEMGPNTATGDIVITNTGTGTAEVEFTELRDDFELLSASGSTMSLSEIMEASGPPLIRNEVPVSVAASSGNQFGTMDMAPAYGPSQDPWISIANLPQVAMDNRVVHIDGRAYNITGGSGAASYTEVYVYDPVDLAWTQLASLPEARNGVAAGAVGNQIVVTGGWAPAGPSPVTWVYDVDADTWTQVADNPVPRAAQGFAVMDGRLWVIGGCTTAACSPMSTDVVSYDVASDTWDTHAAYPILTSHLSCGAVGGELYCSGGNDGTGGTANTYAYDPGSDAWTQVASAPSDHWGSAGASANGLLVVQGGVHGAAVTNATFGYDPSADEWVDLPNAITAVYRGGLACGVYKVGGSIGGFTPTAASEVLPGFDDCAVEGVDVPWMSLSHETATIPPGASMTLQITVNANVMQPGTYTAGVGISSNTPQTIPSIDVTMVVTPPSHWGKLQGTISGDHCNAPVAPLDAATVDVRPTRFAEGPGWTFITESDGGYAHWLNATVGELRIIAAKDGWRPDTRNTTVPQGGVRTENFTLEELGC